MKRAELAIAVVLMTGAGMMQGQIHGGNGVVIGAAPATEKVPVSETLHGETFTDDYRWLEEKDAPGTRRWIDAQMAYTQGYLDQVKLRPSIVEKLTALQRIDDYGVPREQGGKYFFQRRLAAENQYSIYMRVGLHGKDELLVDAGKLSADQNTSVGIGDISKDGRLLLYSVRVGGADEGVIHVLDTETRKELADQLPKARYFGVSLAPDAKGIYYARYTSEGTLVYFHAMGTEVAADKLIFGKEYRGEKLGALDLASVSVTENGRYLVIAIAHGVPAKREDILVQDLRRPGAEIVPLVYGIEARFTERNVGDEFLVRTDYKAPLGRIVKIKVSGAGSDTAEAKWETVIPEGKNRIEGFSVTGGKLFVSRLVDVKTETEIYSLEGKKTGELAYPQVGSGIGNGSVVQGKEDGTEGFYTFTSFLMPGTIYHYDIKTGNSDVFAEAVVPFDASQYKVEQVFYTSNDGTKVPMFIVGKKTLPRDGSARLLMTAYGGFDISLLPAWSAEYAWWMEQGGYFALPNLRGGGEYGEAWHEAGMFERKQNVFDDFYAAAEYLIANKYTSAEHLAIRGRSNGGLLMGAAMTQRPELFGAIWCGYPLIDMLRYQNFLIGRFWTTEYGSAEDAKQFAYIRKYSPYQNVKAGTKYPAIMFFTGDSDTRVDPLHARKMTAEMQRATGSGRPVLLHYSVKSGHSAGVSLTQLVGDQADEQAFLWNETGE